MPRDRKHKSKKYEQYYGEPYKPKVKPKCFGDPYILYAPTVECKGIFCPWFKECADQAKDEPWNMDEAETRLEKRMSLT